MHYIIIGAQASGKGTQADMLAKEAGIIHISTGELLRQEVATGNALGKRLKEHLDRGELVPNDLVFKMLQRAIDHAKGGFILDGFPRTVEQAKFLDVATHIDKVIVLEINDKTAIARISGRRECAKGHNYNLLTNPPKKASVCDIDGLPLKQRSDDTPVAIKKRLDTYHQETEPVIAHYKDKVININGEPPIQDVHFAILKALHHKKQ